MLDGPARRTSRQFDSFASLNSIWSDLRQDSSALTRCVTSANKPQHSYTSAGGCPVRATRVSVTGLFGTFDHDLPLGGNERLVIIYGPNGFGKTVTLKMIAALAQGNISIFERTPFDEFRIDLEDGTARIVRRQTAIVDDKKQVRLTFLIRTATGHLDDISPSPMSSDIPRSVLDHVDNFVPGLRRWRNGWRDNQGREYSLDWVVEQYPAARAALPPKYRPQVFPGDLNVFFVETNRLGPETADSLRHRTFSLDDGDDDDTVFGRPHRRPPLRVEQYSENIIQRINSVLAEYAKQSQESDRTFPERLVAFVREHEPVMTAKDILARMSQLEIKRQRLITLGFLDSESDLVRLTESDAELAPEVLTIYVQDVQDKLKVFDDLADRIGRLRDIVNSRFQYKSLQIQRGVGFSVSTDIMGPLSLDDLSSGEQHELVVLYELLFRVPRNGLVLVDEPEISLHVAWQARFLPDLIDILELTDAYGIVATHSPVIIGDRSDLAVALKGPSGSGSSGTR
jgi:hypothetical protein